MRSRRHDDAMDALPDGRLIHVDYRRMVCLLARAIGRRPADSFGLLVVSVATVAVLMNALWLQPRPHPSPILAMTPPPKPVAAANAPSRVRPTETDGARTEAAASARAAQIVGDIQRELSRRGFYDGPTDGIYGARTDTAIRDFADASGLKITEGPSAALLQKIVQTSLKIVHMPQAAGAVRRDDPIGALLAPSKRVIAIQRALRDFGYGQLKPSGVLDLETMDAIKRFENAHKLPATGLISDRLVRELAGATGRPLE